MAAVLNCATEIAHFYASVEIGKDLEIVLKALWVGVALNCVLKNYARPKKS